MRKILLCFALPLLLLPAPAVAASVETGVKALATCVKARDAEACRAHISLDSQPLFERFTDYDLMSCLPEDAAYLSHKMGRPFAMARTRVSISQKDYAVQLAMVQEDGEWKLDLPETLRRGLGPQWQERLDTVEQLYLLLQSQLRGKLNCAAIRKLGSGMTATQ